MADRPLSHGDARGSVWSWTLAGVVLILALAPLVGNQKLISAYVAGVIILAGINATLAVSLNIINGLTGQFSIGHAGFMAVGAYVAAAVTCFGGTALERLAAHGAIDPTQPALGLMVQSMQGLPLSTRLLIAVWFAGAVILAGLVSAAAGMLVGFPTLRLRGDYLAIATLGFSEMTRVALVNLETMGGASGFNGTAPFGFIPSYANFTAVYLVALACIVLVTALKRSTEGRALLAVREDEVAAEAVGVDTTRYKVLAFALSAFFAGAAGALLAHDQGNIVPQMFNFQRSIEVIAMVVLGGSGSTTGCVLAALGLTVLREGLRDLAAYRLILYAEILLVMMLVRRQGLLGSREITAHDWHAWGQFLRQHGLRGVWRSLGEWLRGSLRRVWQSLVRADQSRFTHLLAGGLWLLPWLDLLAVRLLPPATQPYPRTWLAELIAALSSVLHQGLAQNLYLRGIAADLQLPLAPNLGLSAALLLLWLPWWTVAYGVAAGHRRAGWWAAGAAALFCWHGVGSLLVGHRHPRTLVEAALAVVVLLATLGWLGRLRRRG
ncbi:MAG: branched-chain amino acid ABC transporter permease [Fimbriimonadaceae bacterium]|nr:branched-chain amino acid ABC transporter permease [Fimbriimonadaceae bacterium]